MLRGEVGCEWPQQWDHDNAGYTAIVAVHAGHL